MTFFLQFFGLEMCTFDAFSALSDDRQKNFTWKIPEIFFTYPGAPIWPGGLGLQPSG